MRTIRRTSVLVIVLATAPVVFANAQSATQPPASPAVTRQDLQQVQDRQNHQARQIQKMRNEVNGVKAVQGEQRNSITTLGDTDGNVGNECHPDGQHRQIAESVCQSRANERINDA